MTFLVSQVLAHPAVSASKKGKVHFILIPFKHWNYTVAAGLMCDAKDRAGSLVVTDVISCQQRAFREVCADVTNGR